MTRRQAVAITESLIVDALRRMTPGQRAALLALAAPSDPAPASTAGGKREARVKLAKQYGYTGSDDDIAIRSRGLRRVLSGMNWDADDIQTFNDMDQTSKDKVLRLALETLDKPPAFEPNDIYGVTTGTFEHQEGEWKTSIKLKGDLCIYDANHPSGHFKKIVWKKGVGLVEYASGYGAHADGYRLKREVTSQKR